VAAAAAVAAAAVAAAVAVAVAAAAVAEVYEHKQWQCSSSGEPPTAKKLGLSHKKGGIPGLKRYQD
jgi:hypothetical protein